MKLVFVSTAQPATGQQGTAVMAMGILKALLQKGHEVTVVAPMDFSDHNYSFFKYFDDNDVILKEMGVETIYIKHDFYELLAQVHSPSRQEKIVGMLQPSEDPQTWSEIFPHLLLREKILNVLADLQPDAILAFHFPALSLLYEQINIPILGLIGDLEAAPKIFRWRMIPFQLSRHYLSVTYNTWRQIRLTNKATIALMKMCAVQGAFTLGYTNWLREHGVKDCQYFRPPIPDAGGEDWLEKRSYYEQRNKKSKIILIGALKGAATATGIKIFAHEILPRLESQLGRDSFEVHMIGAGTPPEEVREALDHPAIILRGQVEPSDPEFQSADVLLVPTPIELGIRIRILVALAFGCPVVTHRANIFGLPELIHEQNAMVSDQPDQLADYIVRIIKEPELRHKLQQTGRKTYESTFSIETAGERINAHLDMIAHNGNG